VDQIESEFRQAGIACLAKSAYEPFRAYLDLLLRWNSRLNLTALREPEQIIRRHFVESAFAAQHLPVDIGSLLDYGSGAGFPGIPIAICRPGIEVTLAESQGKKAAFLREVVRTLGIRVEVFAGRVEAMPEQRRFDAVSLRAVDQMELAIPEATKRTRAYVVLLTTTGSEAVCQEFSTELEWLAPIPLPNATRTILAIGRKSVR
jgi:16S rRNA (guanine527-N7)-methyltransferase